MTGSSVVHLILARIHDLEIQGLYSNPIQFYDFLQNRVMIVFRPKFDSDHDTPEFSLVLSKKQTYDSVQVPCYPTQGYARSSA
jgi:ICP0-binding domain of Ubiquitin-specific protease 7